VTPFCAPGGSGEAAFSFTAPASGAYVFDTLTSSFDTVLSLIDPGCFELGCNDDTMNVTSQLTASLSAGQTVFIVVDGFGGSEGSYALHVTPPGSQGCPDGDLGSTVPQSVSGSTVGAGDDVAPSCAPPGGPDRAFTFTPPVTGVYTITTIGSTFDTVLHVHAGACGGPTIACNDDASGVQSSLTVMLPGGQPVVIAVDGFGASAGNFVLNISN
jgi:hypothetical protein